MEIPCLKIAESMTSKLASMSSMKVLASLRDVRYSETSTQVLKLKREGTPRFQTVKFLKGVEVFLSTNPDAAR